MRAGHANQRGISLFIVLVMVLLSTLFVIWSSRTALLNELVTGNESDYQRAFEAAQAMARDAELDIKGSKVDGITPCKANAGYVGCRPLSGGIFFPQDEADFQSLTDALAGTTPPCAKGICVNTVNLKPAFFATPDDLAAMTAGAKSATYGAYTGAKATEASNPLLINGAGAAPRAWYWVEVLHYDTSAATAAGPAQELAPDSSAPFVYRITAVAQGLKPGSQAVVQTVFVRRRLKS